MKLSNAGVRPSANMPMIIFFSEDIGLLHVEAETIKYRAIKRRRTIGMPILNPAKTPDRETSNIKPNATKKKALSINDSSV